MKKTHLKLYSSWFVLCECDLFFQSCLFFVFDTCWRSYHDDYVSLLTKFSEVLTTKSTMELSEVKITIRALLMSCKDGLTVMQLMKDFKSEEGSPVPFKEFGFDNVFDFLLSIPDVLTVRAGFCLLRFTIVSKFLALWNFLYIISMGFLYEGWLTLIRLPN